MPSIPPSPLRHSHRHSLSHSSSTDFSPVASDAYVTNGFQSPPQSPRSSAPPSPSTPRQHNVRSMNGSNRASGDFSLSATADAGGDGGGGGGLGSLADELADAWEEEEDDGYGYASGIENAPVESQQNEVVEGEEEGYIETTTGAQTTTPSAAGSGGLSPELVSYNHHLKQRLRNGHHNRYRRQESSYDGSDYGNDSDLEEAADISPSLEGQMAEIESLARRGIENNGSENDHVIRRAIEGLKDLGAQSSIENSAMRLITAHTSITSHLTHQTRTLQTLAHPLLLSHFPLLSTDAVDALIPLIDEGLLPNLPFPFPGPQQQQQQQQSSRPSTPSLQSSTLLNPLVSLQALIAQTADLTHSLRGLSDTLYEARQLTSTASRRLRSARELVAELRREEEGREEGTRWIEKGDWDRRLKEREAGRVCGEVVSGFEEVCGEWREKLFGAAAGAGAGTAAEVVAG